MTDHSPSPAAEPLAPHQAIGLDGRPFDLYPPHLASQGPAAAGQYAGGPAQLFPAPSQPAVPLSYATRFGNPAGRGAAEAAVVNAPRTSIEANNLGWYAAGLGLVSCGVGLLDGVFNVSGLPRIAGLVAAATGLYFGLRSHNAGVNGFATNGRLGLGGAIASVMGGLSLIAVFVFTWIELAAGTS